MDYIDAIRTMKEEKNKFLDEYIDYSGVSEAYDMAIKALNQRIPRPVIHGNMGTGIVLFACPNCNTMVLYTQRFCNMCGQRLKWNENN